MRRLLLCLCLPAALLLLPAQADAVGTLSSPASSTAYGATLPVTYDLGSGADPQSDVRLVFTYTSGTNAIPGSVWTVVLTGAVVSQTFTLHPAAPSGDTQVTSVTPTSGGFGTVLPEGTYSVALLYTDNIDGPVTVQTVTGVVLDRTTQTPTVAAPTTYFVATAATPLPVSFTLPEAAAPDTVTLTISGSSWFHEIELATANESAGSHTFTLNPLDLDASPQVDSITGSGNVVQNGMQSVVLSYRDALGNPASTITVVGVFVDTVTAPPILAQPASGSPYPSTIPLSVSLPELPNSGTVKVTFTGPVTRRIFLAGTGTGTTTVALDPANLTAAGAVSSAPDGNTLTEGTYAVQLSYEDSRGNPAATVTTTGVVLGPLPTTTVTVTTTVPSVTTVTETTTVTEPTTITETREVPVTVTQTTPTALAPVPAALKSAWATKKAGGRWTLRASFKPQPGAKTYTLTATSGKRTARGVCRTAGGRVTCTATVTAKGTWALQAKASDGDTVIAQAAKTVRLR